jgi:hypothetical protein
MFINLIPDNSVSSAPAGFTAAIQAAANTLDQIFGNNITLNIRYGWGTFNNQVDNTLTGTGGADGNAVAGASNIAYSTLKQLLSSGPSTYDMTAYQNLPSNNTAFPNQANNFFVSSAQEKALGTFSGNGSSVDGAIGFGTASAPGFWQEAALHEIAHAMGRDTGFPYEGNVPTIMDLFRYDSTGHFQWTAGQPSYLSIDGGRTRLANFSTSKDFGDFAIDSLTPADPFDYQGDGSVTTLTRLDVETMNVLGFQVATPVVGNDNPLPVRTGMTATISRNYLSVSSPANVFADTELTYNLVTGPTDGTLLKNGSATSSFTQDDIDNNRITYQETAGNVSSDSFTFNVSDAAGDRTANTSFQFQITPPPTPRFVGTGDFAAGGLADIAWQNGGGATLWVCKGSTLTQVVPAGQMGSAWTEKSVGDFNGDGTADLLWTNANGQVAIWEMNGANLQGCGVPAGQMGNAWQVAGIGDFNGDGKADILWGNGGSAAIWTMNGMALDDCAVSNGVMGNAWHVVAIGDFNADGRSDVLWEDSTTGNVAIWEMNGANLSGFDPRIGQMGSDWKIAGVGHFNGAADSTSDVVWVDGANHVQIWQMAGGHIANMITPNGQYGLAWHLEGVGNFAGDANSDLLWMNNSGAAYLWEINGTQVSQVAMTSPTGNVLQLKAGAQSQSQSAPQSAPQLLTMGVAPNGASSAGSAGRVAPGVDGGFGALTLSDPRQFAGGPTNSGRTSHALVGG